MTTLRCRALAAAVLLVIARPALGQATVDIKDGAGTTRTVRAPNPNGRAVAASSAPVVLSTEDKAALDAVNTATTAAAAAAGAKTDAKSVVTDATPASMIALFKGQIDRLQAIVTALTGAATETGNLAAAKVDLDTLVARVPTLGQKLASQSQSVVLASDQVLPLPNGAATDSSLTSIASKLDTLHADNTAAGPTVLPPADATDKALIGPVAETAPTTDTASSGLNGRLQRLAQDVTTLNATVAAQTTAINTLLKAGQSVVVSSTPGLTDTQLRANPVPITGTVTAVPSGTTPVSLAALPATADTTANATIGMVAGGTAAFAPAGQGTVSFEVTGTWTGTLTPQILIGSTWANVSALPILVGGQAVTTITANGTFELTGGGKSQVRLNGTAGGTGAASIVWLGTSAPAIIVARSGNPNNFVTSVQAVAGGGATPYHYVSAASTNSTLVATGAHTLYSLTITGLNATAAYVRIYDSAAAPTCSSATGATHSYLVIGSATAQGGLVVPLPTVGEVYANGLGFCITGGLADTDNTPAVAGVLVNASFK